MYKVGLLSSNFKSFGQVYRTRNSCEMFHLNEVNWQKALLTLGFSLLHVASSFVSLMGFCTLISYEVGRKERILFLESAERKKNKKRVWPFLHGNRQRDGEKKNISLDQEELVKKKTRKKSWSIKQKIRRCGLKKRLDSVHFPIKGKKGWALFWLSNLPRHSLETLKCLRKKCNFENQIERDGGGDISGEIVRCFIFFFVEMIFCLFTFGEQSK